MDLLRAASSAEAPESNVWTAASEGNLPRVQMLMREEQLAPNVQDENGYSCMHAAASYGHAELAQWLLEQGASPSIPDGDGDTPLHCCESRAVAALLVGAGALVDVANSEGITPAAQAMEDGREEMVGFWLERGQLSQDAVEEWRRNRAAEEADDECIGLGGEGFRRAGAPGRPAERCQEGSGDLGAEAEASNEDGTITDTPGDVDEMDA